MITREWAFSVVPGRHTCQQCNGGSTRERSCNVWDSSGYRFALCHRASCGAFAKYPLLWYSETEKAAVMASNEVLSPYTGDRYPLRPNEREWFREKFGCLADQEAVGYGAAIGRCIMPIRSPDGAERGVMEWGYRPKHRRIWKAKNEPMIHWTQEADYFDGVYLVEDWLSAEKLWETSSVRAVALLGTSLNAPAVAEIQAHANHCVIALDSDATTKAFMLARRWGAAFSSCMVQVLTRDIKDMPAEEIQQMVDKNNARFPAISSVFKR